MTLIWLTNEEAVYSLIARGWELRRVKQGIDYKGWLMRAPIGENTKEKLKRRGR